MTNEERERLATMADDSSVHLFMEDRRAIATFLRDGLPPKVDEADTRATLKPPTKMTDTPAEIARGRVK